VTTAMPLAPGDALPFSAYADPALLDREQRAIFRRSWQIAGLTSDVAEPGDYLTTDVAGVPVVVVRDNEGVLHAHLNVCPHRGMVIAQGAGRAKLLQCPNHAWSFDLDGRLRAAPRSDLEADFDCNGLSLRPASVLEWGPLVLVHLDPDAPRPDADLATMEQSVDRYDGLRFADLTPHGEPVDWEIGANWKIVCENYLECYHCAVVHPAFSKVFDTRGFRYALEPQGSVLSATAHVRETRDHAGQQAVLDTTGPLRDSHWHLLFPATTVNVYPGYGAVEFTWYWPSGVSTTRGRTVIAFPPGVPEAYAEQIRALSLQVGEEDNVLVEGIHRGVASGALEGPRILPRNEALLVEFQRLVVAALGEEHGAG
jgi:phenylpropionate dioxygenase-like ring-hydroxylating dioxygenase large terminal subunit